MILHEYEFLGLCDLLKLCFISFIPVRIICNIRVIINRISRIVPDIPKLSRNALIHLRYCIKLLIIGRQHRKKLFIEFLIAVSHLAGTLIESEKQIQEYAEYRECRYQNKPGHLNRRRLMLGVDEQYQGNSSHGNKIRYPYIFTFNTEI